METPVSLPEQALARAVERATELSMTPEEFIAVAVAHYLAYQDSLHLARDLDKILADPSLDDRDPAAVEAA